MRKRGRSVAGLALIEVMFAAGILSLALVMMFGSAITISKLGHLASTRTTLASHLSAVMEDVRSSSFEQALAYDPSSLAGRVPGETVTLSWVDQKGEAHPLPVNPAAQAEPPPNPVEIRASVSMADANERIHSLSAVALVSR